MKRNILLGITLVAIGIAGRLMPHVWNTTPILASLLFASTYLNKKSAVWLLIVVMGVSDIFLGTYQWQIMLSVYGSLLLACFTGSFIRTHKHIQTIIAAPLLFSTLFFVITNWAVWQFSPLYSHTFQGLLDSYTMAIPFFKNSLVGDLVYTSLFFGIYEGVVLLRAHAQKKSLMKDEILLIS